MKVELIYVRADSANAIGRSAAKCYDGKTDRESNVRRAKSCRDKGHLATMRFAYAEFDILDISRVCSHQIVRIAHAGILQESQRYVKQTKINYIIPPEVKNLPQAYINKWKAALELTSDLYAEGIELGLKKEDARYILPQSCTTGLSLCMNFQAWKGFLKNRNDKAAQWEVREVAQEIQRLLNENCPELF